MARAIGYNVDRVEIAFPHDNQEHVVSLLPYLQFPDVAVGVIFEVYSTALLGENGGGHNRLLVQTGGVTIDLVHEGIVHHTDRLSGAQKEVTLLAEHDKIHVCIVAELLDPGAVMHASAIDVSPTGGSEVNTWVNRSVTLQGGDSAEDVEAVLLTFTHGPDTSPTSSGEFGARALGGYVGKLWQHQYHSDAFFFPIKAPNGQYQIYIEGKQDPFEYYTAVAERGYIKKGHGFQAILSYTYDSPPTATDWQARSAAAFVPAGAEAIFAAQQLEKNIGNAFLGTRAIGSNNDYGRRPTATACGSACPFKLDFDRQYEYVAYNQDPETWILAYTMLVSAAGSGTAKLVSVQASPTRPATLSATPATESVLGAEPEIGSMLSAVPEVLSTLSAVPDAGSVLSGEPDIGDVLRGKPAVTE